MRSLYCAATALLCVASLGVSPLRAAEDKPLELSAQLQARLGLHLQTLKSVSLETTLPAAALVIDPVAFIHLDTDLQAAEAAALLSRQERDRLKSLQGEDSQVSVKALEAAQAQFATDAAHVSGLKTEVAVGWGTGLARMGAAQRRALVDALGQGTAALLRVDAQQDRPRIGQQGTPRSVIVTNPVTGKPLAAQLLGLWPQAGDNLRGSAWLVRVNAEGFAVGQSTDASLAFATRAEGVLIPAAAVVRWNALQWVFVAADSTHFERRPLGDATQHPEGWLTNGDFKDGEQIVVQGAATLLSAETLDAD
jgi:hypothetical protein